MENENAKCACHGATLTRFVQPIILFSLSESPCHGYELTQKIAHTELWQDNPPDAAGVYRILRDMERRGLITSSVTADSKAGMGKRVFSITDSGRVCMANWAETLERYRSGIDEVIVRLHEALDSQPRVIESAKNVTCCCNSETE
ncbi:MAG: PadR family transcriptional regulator [Eubacteriales bacterium]